MENFVVSARKYRPTTFDTVVGQNSITNTLKNAIKTNHLAQAFLFCGSRGVGKTTCARILAKTINCSNRTENTEACNTCDSCTSFNEGASLNIQELDAASNNSVDDIRNLIDQVRFAPQIGSHKVYIVDEVHMLTTSAFNAFLKTLEEPPAHAIFILATTEKHKIIPTILSRCQIFDFNRIEVNDIANHLQEIAQKEGIEAEDEALHMIAQKADGALRDALSIFDQLVSFSGSNLSYEAVIKNLNILDYDYYFKATDLVLNNDIPSTLLLLNEVIQNGFEGSLFINGLATHFRNLLVCLDKQTISLLEVGKSVKQRYADQAANCNATFLIQALEICRQCDTQYRASKNKRLLVELTLMQLASVQTSANTEKKKPIIQSVEENKQSSSIDKKVDIAVSPINTQKESNSNSEERENIQVQQEVEEVEETTEISIDNSGKEVSKEPSSSVINETTSQKLSNKFSKLAENNNSPASLSIKELTQKNEEEEVEAEVYTSEARTEFSEEQFQEKWKELIEMVKSNKIDGNSIVLSAISTHKPKLLDDFKVELAVDNKSQQEEMNLKRTDLHDFLRKSLHNGGIEIQFVVQKDPTQRKAYTDEEKFNKMAEENPNLIKLKKELGLDFL